jgi:hypothetical protein
MTHLTSDELLDAMEGMLASDRQAHLAACEECRRQLDDLAGAMNDARQVSVPEPSPLFWNHFAARVNDAIDAEPAGAWPQWLRWQVLLPLGATAMIILALMMAVPKQDEPEFVDADAAEVVDTLAVPDDNWVMVATLVGEIDLDTASAAGVIEPGVAERAVLTLTSEEQQELTRLLKAELTRAKS